MKYDLLYEGKAKRVYRAEGLNDQLVLAYKNDATALNGKKRQQFDGKGQLNNAISSCVFAFLHEQGIESHFLEEKSETEQIVRETSIIPLEVVVRNLAAGSITTRLGVKENTAFPSPIVELFYKDDALNDPLINDQHALYLSDIKAGELEEIKQQTLSVNRALQELFYSINLTLVDFKLEFGRLKNGRIIVADEISPDTCRLWDRDTQERMDKDVFRQGEEGLTNIYQKVLNRLNTTLTER